MIKKLVACLTSSCLRGSFPHARVGAISLWDRLKDWGQLDLHLAPRTRAPTFTSVTPYPCPCTPRTVLDNVGLLYQNHLRITDRNLLTLTSIWQWIGCPGVLESTYALRPTPTLLSELCLMSRHAPCCLQQSPQISISTDFLGICLIQRHQPTQAEELGCFIKMSFGRPWWAW